MFLGCTSTKIKALRQETNLQNTLHLKDAQEKNNVVLNRCKEEAWSEEKPTDLDGFKFWKVEIFDLAIFSQWIDLNLALGW